MKKPVVKKFPTEMFGCPYVGQENALKLALRQQYCKYIHGTCVKPRKSEPDVKVGICSVGYKGEFLKEFTPVILCPQRLKEDTLFETIREKYLGAWKNVEWIPEVNIGVGGSVDYVAVTRDHKGRILDFLCVELQAAGTTGSPYQAILDYKKHERFLQDSYRYGINWANEFSKTMMQQAYKKGKIVEHWHRKIVFAVQDVAMDFIRSSSNTSRLTKSDASLPVDFCTFKLGWSGTHSAWKMHFDDIVSTDIEGINLILGGADVDLYPTEEDFILNIVKKGISDGIFDSETYKKLYFN